MGKVTRTVKNDLTVTVDGIDYEPKGQHAEQLMRSWIGKRVQVQPFNYWETEWECSLRLPAHNVDYVARLHCPARPTPTQERDDD